MTIEAPPLWLQGGTYPARLDRFIIAQTYDEGVLSPTACKVTQRGAGANFSVDVAVGEFVITGDDQTNQGNYMGRITATENAVVSAAPGSNSRYDLVTLRVNDPNAGGNTGNTVTVVIVAGTPAASPSVPALPPSSLPLAVIGPIATATASITNSIINDVWTGAGPAFALSCRLLAGERGPAGQIIQMAGDPARINGWLPCDGRAISRTTFVGLFTAIGTSYGVGDGSTTFNIPDGRDRVFVNKGTTFATAGSTGGESAHTLSQAELPNINISVNPPSTAVTITDPGHAHTYANNNDISGPTGTGATVPGVSVPGSNTGSSTTGITATVDIAAFNAPLGGSGTPFTNMQPYQVVAGSAIRT